MAESLSILIPVVGLGVFLSLAYVGERHPPVGWLVLVLLALADLFALAIGALLLVTAPFMGGALREGGEAPVAPGLSPEEAAELADTLTGILPPIGAILLVLGALGLLLLLPPLRALLARLIPIDPGRVVHTAALHYALLLVLISGVTAVFVPLLLQDPELIDVFQESIAESGLISIWAQNIAFVVLAALGVGLVVARGPRETLDRLGLTLRIDWRWWLGGTAVAMATAVGTDFLWGRLSPEGFEEVGRLSEALIEPILEYGILGALTIGLAAGIGEEILFRGAAQERFGVLLTALLFAVLHTQYSISPALLLIFVLGVVLGLARVRANTTTAIAIHATYNFTIAMIALYGG